MIKDRIREHYDVASPYYQELWGAHIHHGYWLTGHESKETAQENLTKLLVERAHIVKNQNILDVGCGIGGSSIYLAKNHNAKVTGITLSPVQVEMAQNLAKGENLTIDFQQMDAEQMKFDVQFDCIWSVEALSHLNDQRAFFKKAYEHLKPGGVFAIIDWFKKEDLTPEQEAKFIEPIRKGMLTPNMKSMRDYKQFMEEAGVTITEYEDISAQVSKTWDICFETIQNPALWKMALSHGKDFIEFLKSFQAMRSGFASKTFVYGLIVGKKE